MPKFPQFMEFAILKATPEILYSSTICIVKIILKLFILWGF